MTLKSHLRDPPEEDFGQRGPLGAAIDGNNESPQTQSRCSGGKGVVIPSSGECPEPFSYPAFIRVGKCRGI